MKTHEELYAQMSAYESQVIEASNLVAALQFVAWQFAQYSSHDPELHQIRSAVIGIGDALEEVTAIKG